MFQSKSRGLADRHGVRSAKDCIFGSLSSETQILRTPVFLVPIRPTFLSPHSQDGMGCNVLHISADPGRFGRFGRPSSRFGDGRGEAVPRTPPTLLRSSGFQEHRVSQLDACASVPLLSSGANVLRSVWAPQKLKYNRNFLLAEEHPLCLYSLTQTSHHNITQWVSQKFTPKSPEPPSTLSAPMTGRLTWPRTAMLSSRELSPRNVLRIMPTACTNT